MHHTETHLERSCVQGEVRKVSLTGTDHGLVLELYLDQVRHFKNVISEK